MASPRKSPRNGASPKRFKGGDMLQELSREYGLEKSKDYINVEDKFNAHNYHPLPVVLEKGEGCRVWDVEGKEYLDFLSAYSAVNQGHCHPRIVKALVDQASKLTLTSRAFHNSVLAPFTKYITSFFGYDRVLTMNSGVEAGESACKLIRKWGYEVKKIPNNKAVILFAENNFWGRTLAACSSSTDPSSFENYGPFLPGMEIVPYNDVNALKKKFEANKNIAGFYVEPIQGEAGVVIPSADYLPTVQKLCKQHNVLLACDEIQTGLGRTGKMLASEHWKVKPDILILGKALSGGVYPVSAVLCRDEVMLTIKPGQHGSTYGGNPIAARVAMEALQVLKDEDLCSKSESMGMKFRVGLKEGLKGLWWVKEVRGMGLMNAIELKSEASTKGVTAWDICLSLKNKGLLAKQTHDTTIRFAPPLVISPSEMEKALSIILSVFTSIRI